MSEILDLLETELRARQEREAALREQEANRVLYEEGTTYKVLAPYVTAKVPNVATGTMTIVGFYSGGLLPEGTDPASVQHLLDSQLVVPADDPVAELLAVPAGTPLPGRPPNEPVAVAEGSGQPVPPLSEALLQRAQEQAQEVGGGSDEITEETVTPPEPPDVGEQPDAAPPRAADPKDAWVDYAVTQGADRDQAMNSTKAELIEQYGG